MSAETRAKLAVGILYPVLHGTVLYFCYRGSFAASWSGLVAALGRLDPATAWALALPALAVVFFSLLHFADRRNPRVRGLVSRAREEPKRAGEYAASAISRQSIHSGIGIGVIAALRESAMSNTLSTSVPARFAIVALVAATLAAMISVLCYAHSTRWARKDWRPEEPLVKRNLLKKASMLDQFAWYVLMIGLVWALAVADRLLSMCANLAYGAGLYFYYFQWLRDPAQRDGGPAAPELEKARRLSQSALK